MVYSTFEIAELASELLRMGENIQRTTEKNKIFLYEKNLGQNSRINSNSNWFILGFNFSIFNWFGIKLSKSSIFKSNIHRSSNFFGFMYVYC